MECNWLAFTVFLACATQWRMLATPAGLLYQGLHYVDCQVVLQLHSAGPDVFFDLQAMEDAALEILNEAD